MAIKEYPLPDTGSRPRRIAITSDDIIWYGDYSRGRLGRLDPKTGTWVNYPLPHYSNLRRVFVDDSGAHPVVWTGNDHAASVIKLEPLD
jgi:streptogramin lyase